MVRCLASILLVLSPFAATAACLKAEPLSVPEPDAAALFAELDRRCEEGLSLLAAGRPAEALPFLRGAIARPELLAIDLTLPFAEALFGAGAPLAETLEAYERVLPISDVEQLRAARLLELAERLDVGQAEQLLAANPERPAASWLRTRAQRDKQPAAAPIKTGLRLGLLVPLTGKLAPVGRRILDGAALALGPGVVLLARDSEAPSGLQPILEELAREGVLAVLGPVDRSKAAQATALSATLGLPHFRLDVGGEASGAASAIRLGPSRDSELRAIVDRGRREGMTRFLVVHADTPFGIAFAASARRAVQSAGLALVDAIQVAGDASDLTTPSRRVFERRPDVVFIGDAAPRIGPWLRYLAAAGVVSRGLTGRVRAEGEVRFVQLAGPSEWFDVPIAAADEKYAQGLWISTEWDAGRSPTSRKFVEDGAQKLGRTPGFLEALAFDGTRLVLVLGSDAAALETHIRRARAGGTLPSGVLGPLGLDTRGEPVRTTRLVRLRGRVFEPVPWPPK